MPDKMIKKVSRVLNKGSYLRSSSIVLSRFLFAAVFGVLPAGILLAVNKTGLKDSLNCINPALFPCCLTTVFLVIILLAGMTFSAFSVGENAWYTGRLTRKKLCGKRLRFWFAAAHSFKAFRLRAVIFTLKLLWTVALISPSILVFSAVIATAITGGIEFYLFMSLTVGGIVLLAVGLVFRFIIVQRYYLAPYLIAENPKLSVFNAVMQSKNLLDGHLLRIVSFKIKFLPCFLLYPLIFPAIYFHPHYKQCCCVLAKEIRL